MSKTITDTAAAERLAFHAISADTGKLLRDNRDYIMGLLPKALDAFYDHVETFPEGKQFFRDRKHMDHAKLKQIEHWDIVLKGKFDSAYVESVTNIGEVHNRIGLEPRWYIGGYSFLLTSLLTSIARRKSTTPFGRSNREETLALQEAITRATLLDMDYAIAVYLDAGKRQRNEIIEQIVGFEGSCPAT